MHRATGVETHPRFAGDKGVIGKARIHLGIFHNKYALFENGVGAEREVARGFMGIDAAAREQPLPIAIEQANHRNRHIEGGFRHAG